MSASISHRLRLLPNTYSQELMQLHILMIVEKYVSINVMFIFKAKGKKKKIHIRKMYHFLYKRHHKSQNP